MASNKFETLHTKYQALLARNPSSYDKMKLERELWEAYTATFSGRTPHLQRRWFHTQYGEPEANYNYRARIHPYAFPKVGPPSKVVPQMLEQVDAGKINMSAIARLVIGTSKVAIKYGVTYERALEVIMANFHDSPKYSLTMDYSNLFTIENKFTPTTGLQFKKTVMHLAADFAKSTRAIGTADPYGEQIQKAFFLNLSEVVTDYLGKIGQNRREQKVFSSVQISREEFDWACVTLSIDRKKVGDYGQDIRMDLVGKKYRQQIALVHPDRNPSEAAQKMFAAVKEAKELLDKYNIIRNTK